MCLVGLFSPGREDSPGVLWSSGILFCWITHEILNWTLCPNEAITCLIGCSYEQFHTVKTSGAKETNNTYKDRVKHCSIFSEHFRERQGIPFPPFNEGKLPHGYYHNRNTVFPFPSHTQKAIYNAVPNTASGLINAREHWGPRKSSPGPMF